MHVEATTRLVPGEVLERIAMRPAGPSESTPPAAPLRCELDRQPPRVFLAARPRTFAPAAELRIDPLPEGSHVILRLMWGPLPAPFPRALAGAGVLLALAVLRLAPPSPSWIAAALGLGLVPALVLWRQRSGERRLQDRLSGLLGGCVWSPRPHAPESSPAGRGAS